MSKNNIKHSRSLHCHACGLHLTAKNKAKGNHTNECKGCNNLRKQGERKKRQLLYKWEAVVSLGGHCDSCNKKATKTTMVCFDFHHINEYKRKGSDTVSDLIANARPLKVVLKEAEKCILFCACCHRLHHQKYGY